MSTRLSSFLLIGLFGITVVVPEGLARKSSDFRIPGHLALQLVKHPELNEPQVRIILDAIVNKAPGKTEAEFLKTYYATAALPLNERKASFRNASPNRKSALWRTHLALFLAKRPELNDLQKETILAAMSLATPEHFEIRPSASAWKTKVQDPLRSLEKQIVAAFSLEEAAKIFATLGDDPESGNDSGPCTGVVRTLSYKPFNDFSPYKPWINSRFVAQEKDKKAKDKEKDPDFELELSACQCSTESDWCALNRRCAGTRCTKTQSGCGTLWSYPCDGESCT